MHSWRLNRPEIQEQRTGIVARETKRRHVWMIDHQPFAQSIRKSVEIHPPIERTEGGRTNMRTLAAPANRVAGRTHSLCKGAPALLQRGGLAVLG
jgi:hypothetical protein